LTIIWTFGIFNKLNGMIIRTRVFDIASSRFQNLAELAWAMKISVSQVYRVREGKGGIN